MLRIKIRRSKELDDELRLVEFRLREHINRGYQAHRRATRTTSDMDGYLNVALKNYVESFGIPERGEEIQKVDIGGWLRTDTLILIERIAWWMNLPEEESLEKVIEAFLTKNGYSMQEEFSN